MSEEDNYKLKKSKTIRLSDSAITNINYMVNETKISESELLRSIIEKSIAEYRLKKALDAVDSGKIGISGGAKISGLSYRAFYDKMIENGVKLDYGDTYVAGKNLDKIQALIDSSISTKEKSKIKQLAKSDSDDHNKEMNLDKILNSTDKLNNIKLKKALAEVKSGKLSISGGAQVAGLSYRAFFEKVVESKVLSESDKNDIRDDNLEISKRVGEVFKLMDNKKKNNIKKKKVDLDYSDINIGGGLDKVHKSIKKSKDIKKKK